MKNPSLDILADFSNKSGLIYEFFLEASQNADYLPATIRTWQPNLHAFVRWIEAETRGQATLHDWTLSTLKLYLAYLKQKPQTKGARIGLRPRTIHSHFAALRAFERWCVDCKLLGPPPDYNPHYGKWIGPASAIELPVFDQAQRAILSPQEARAILQACAHLYPERHKRLATAVISVFFCTGLRYEDVLGLKLRNVHFGAAPADNYLIAEHSKGNQEFKIEIPPETVEAIAAWLTERKEMDCHNTNDWLFALTKTRRIGSVWWKAIRAEIQYRTGLNLGERFQAHAARRVFSVHCEDQGMPPSQIKDKLNHKTLSTTLLYLETARDSRVENVHLQGWNSSAAPPPLTPEQSSPPAPDPPPTPPPPDARRNAVWRRKHMER